MSRSPIEAMIDATCKCVKCGRAGAPGSCGCWVTLECSKCSKRRLVARDEFDPPGTARVQIQCPDCDPGDFATPTYFDAAGRELSWEDAPGVQAIADRSATAPRRETGVARKGESGGAQSAIAKNPDNGPVIK